MPQVKGEMKDEKKQLHTSFSQSHQLPFLSHSLIKCFPVTASCQVTLFR